ncbi:uncharacterized protein JN550_001927 [Neoarthrinium moseri]|uniref:uncharacterized protein n=1 Tax=Neoarthrinium moseri TaxID=1658444 RepID=UPI001FDBC040|nr:uncharacterized protein JN550_001927 [Neoarthrinium moseri]KAI1875641.1 hypothetical protein JN550_001927 [Neoarthrinium moseri]
MESSSRPVELAMFARSQDLIGMQDMSTSLLTNPFTSNRTLVGPYDRQVRPVDPNPLEQWYTNNDGPWIPKGIAPPGEQSSSRFNAASRGNGFVFSGTYRESISPSECDTLPPGAMPSDSGYGSHGAKPSIATASVCRDDGMDQSQDTQSLAGQFSDLQFQASFNLDPRQWPQAQGQQPALSRAAPSEGKELTCETCQKKLKTNSELKKHKQRHTKPHVCDVPGCNRREGFSTSNDLDRHKRSVHPAESATGNRYRCTHGACRNKDKVWPRADNFRAHIKRVHRQEVGDDDLEKYVFQQPPPQQDVLTDLVGMQPTHVEYNYQLSPGMQNHFSQGYWSQGANASSVIDISPDAATNRQMASHPVEGARSLNPQADVISRTKVGITDSAEGSPSSERDNTISSFPDSGLDAFCDQRYVSPRDLSQHSVAHKLPSLSKDNATTVYGGSLDPSPVNSNQMLDSQSPLAGDRKPLSDGKGAPVPSAADVSSLIIDLKDPDKIKQVLETLQSRGVLEELGYKKEIALATEDKRTEGPANAIQDAQNTQNSCSECPKTFARRCELKKHMKRHEKPYGCTFHGCNKRFGSKNDWKRHENSQHFLLDIWKCDVNMSQTTTAEPCGKVSHRRELFRQHLTNNHQLTTEDVEKKLEDCRVGRNCESRFWCGFCQDIIRIKQKGLHAWTERFNHIDDHLAGRNGMSLKQIDDWKNVDPDAPPAIDASTSDSENGDLPEGSLASISRRAMTSIGVPRHGGHSTGVKRKADSAGDVRHAKRTKNDGTVTKCVSMHIAEPLIFPAV